MDIRLNGLNPLAYQGVAPLSVPQLVFFNDDPTTSDSKNFSIGCIWINRVSHAVWILVNLAQGVATWIKFAASSGFASSFPTDAGTAVPTAGGALTVHGGSNINTSGAGSTVTVNLNNSISVSGTIQAGGDITTVAGSFIAQNGDLNVNDTTNTQTGAALNAIKSRNGGASPVQSGDQLGALSFLGFDSSANSRGAFITSITSGTIGVNRVPSDLEFWTHPDAAGITMQRMIISPAGNVSINAADSGVTLTVVGTTQTAGDYMTADAGGVASTVGFTNTSNTAANGAGTFTILSKSANNANSSGFLKIYVGTTAFWVPFFADPAP